MMYTRETKLLTSLINDENNEFPTGSMVLKGEYLTLDDISRNIDGYVSMDYRSSSIDHFTNLVIAKKIELQTMTKNISLKVHYFMPHSKNKRLMETIGIRDDLVILLEWN